MGDTDIGSVKKDEVVLQNLCDLPVRIELEIDSSVISFKKRVFTVRAGVTKEVKKETEGEKKKKKKITRNRKESETGARHCRNDNHAPI